MAARRLKVEEMTVAWFHKLPDHPRQRDTMRHAVKAMKRHLSKMFVTQEEVSVARFKGVWHKLDGHTRDWLWANGYLTPPHRLLVKRYECDTYEDFVQLYLAHNNKNAAETPKDLAYGRLRELGLPEVGNALANQAAYVSRILFRLQSGAKSWSDHKDGLLHILNMAAWLPQYERFNVRVMAKERRQLHAGLTAAEFITHRRYEEVISDTFWDRFYRRDGQYIDRKHDGVNALWTVYEKRKRGSANKNGSRGSGNYDELTALALHYFESFRKGKRFSQLTNSLNPKFASEYVQRAFGRISVPAGISIPGAVSTKNVSVIPWSIDPAEAEFEI